jgi:hypothetical protein
MNLNSNFKIPSPVQFFIVMKNIWTKTKTFSSFSENLSAEKLSELGGKVKVKL